MEQGEGSCSRTRESACTSLSRRQRCSSQSSSGGHSGMKTQSAPQDREVTRARYLGREPGARARHLYAPQTAYHTQQPCISFETSERWARGWDAVLGARTTGFPAQRLPILSWMPDHVPMCTCKQIREMVQRQDFKTYYNRDPTGLLGKREGPSLGLWNAGNRTAILPTVAAHHF